MKKFKLLVAAAALVGCAGAQALPVIPSWNFVNEAGFKDFAPASSVDATGESAVGPGQSILSTAGTNPNGLATKICWDKNFSQVSCLEVDSPTTEASTTTWAPNGSDVDINGGAAQGAITTTMFNADYSGNFRIGTSLRHDNFVIPGLAEALTNVTFLDGLQLTGLIPGGTTVLAPELSFAVNFTETPNAGSNGVCAVTGWAVNDPRNGGGGCADVFEADLPAGSMLVGGGVDPITNIPFVEFSSRFEVSGANAAGYHKEYEVITRLSGLFNFFSPTSFGFITQEFRTNVLTAQFAVRAVPEPSAIAVFALGLLGLTFVGRRRKQK